MSTNPNNAGKFEITFYFIVILGLFLAMFELMGWARDRSQPAPIDGIRVEERLKSSGQVQESAKDQLENYAYIDETRGQVRVPIKRAIELVVQEWQDPAAGHAKLVTDWDRFNPPPPPPPPEKPSEFE